MGSVRKEIKGNRYGKRLALGEYTYSVTKSGRRLLMEKCKCDCGTEKFVQRSHLLNGASTNCGCMMYEVRSKNGKDNKKHGMEGTQVYRKFMGAKARCINPQNDSYYRYGGRGIKMEWDSFDDFWRDMGDSYKAHVKLYGKEQTTLDRIDVNGNYCKENCRWATWEEQSNNKTSNHNVVYKGKSYPTIAELCRHTGRKYTLVRDRIREGWSVEDAIEKPLSHNSEKNDRSNRGESPSPHTLAQNNELHTNLM